VTAAKAGKAKLTGGRVVKSLPRRPHVYFSGNAPRSAAVNGSAAYQPDKTKKVRMHWNLGG
jgi:hypothetical protein